MKGYYYKYLKRTQKEYIDKIKEQEKEVKKQLDYLTLLHKMYENNEKNLKEFLKENKK